MTYFKGKVGEGHVKGHKYNISTKDGKSLEEGYVNGFLTNIPIMDGNSLSMPKNDWSLVVKTGTVLVMSMIVEKVALDEGKDRAQRNTCPHCYKTHLGVMEDEGWLQW